VSAAALKAGSVKLLGDKYITRKVELGDYTLVADQSDRKAMDGGSPGVKEMISTSCPRAAYRAKVPLQTVQSSVCAPTKTTLSLLSRWISGKSSGAGKTVDCP